MDVNMISKQKDNNKKTTKIGVMGVCSNCHEHENNQVYKFFNQNENKGKPSSKSKS
jgi:cytochrome c553